MEPEQLMAIKVQVAGLAVQLYENADVHTDVIELARALWAFVKEA